MEASRLRAGNAERADCLLRRRDSTALARNIRLVCANKREGAAYVPQP